MDELIIEKFYETMLRSDGLMTRLVGANGDGGYLGVLESLISTDTDEVKNMMCKHCGGLIMEPGVSYCYSGETCSCCPDCRPQKDPFKEVYIDPNLQLGEFPLGWVCPVCRSGVAPDVKRCPCMSDKEQGEQSHG